MDIILIPGLWLDASSWDKVTPAVRQAGHHPHALTLPGLESVAADRSQVGLAEQVGAVVDAIDACPPDRPVLLVGHSLGCAIATAALDARVDRVARVVYIGGFPATSGAPIAAGFGVDGDDLPMPELSEFDEADLRDFDQAAAADFRARAIPAPARLTTDVLVLHDDRRYQVPATAVCPEYTSAQLQQWIADGEDSVQEFTKISSLDYVDVPTGHWPQLTRPDDLAGVIIDAVPHAV